MSFNPQNSVLSGMSTADLQAALADAQKAYINLQTGAQAVTVSYTQGESAKSVTYAKPDVGQLVALIDEIKAMLGMARRVRRPIRFLYR